VLLHRRSAKDVVVWAVPVLGGVMTFFAILLVFVASPFDTRLAPSDGAGMVPSLQNPYMLAHPPMLYLGYVGLTVPFAFAMGALLSGRTDERWIVATRRWTLAAWAFLGVGQLLGSHWAYVEVGWGGYYAWDPVENAALMPWLAATAFLHSVMVQEKKNMLKVWNMLLVILAFCLSIFGTFLTRSGVVNSIHSFTQSSIGGWFLGFIVVVVVLSGAAVRWRMPQLRARTRLESAISREATFLYNNLLLVAFCLTILWGVAFPILTEAVRGETFTVGKPYYDFFLRAFGLPLLLLMGIGPLVAWRRSSLRALGRTFIWPAVFAVVVAAGLIALGAGSSAPGMIAYTFSAFVLGSIVLEFVRGTQARHALGGESWGGAFTSLVARNRRRYGGYVVHAAIVLLAIGVAGSSAYGRTVERQLSPGQTMSVRGYDVTYRGLEQSKSANATETRAVLGLGGRAGGTLLTGTNFYPVEQSSSREVGIHTNWLRAEDLYVILDQSGPNGSVYLKVLVKPLVNLIWLGGLVFVLGSLIALWPDAREERRLALRYAESGVPAT
jgi:cytochrome c-type biogenesis protein CcmF